jgi:uncharacterized protein (DUF302 family)
MILGTASCMPAVLVGTAVGFLLAMPPAQCETAQIPAAMHIYERTTRKPVQEVVEDVEFAISERNFRVTSQLHVGRGIRERDNIEFPDYEVILFCNLGLARRMLELDPGYINYCPGRITVRRGGDTTHIATPLLPEHAGQDTALAALVRDTNTQLRAIVDFGTEYWAKRGP